ncbi:unnamed protein product [Vitrella brassicaformis CCMP3155]|uniref:Uncharacterized protein n=1 Tax=Vitrella brassicaformis (strain CCMP3155) TaxID=1169540 RepID=A0A0G4FUL9_VITBC|nr:unnamed protein product [Vitrella brassicaformis CCMP3155]|eukprot:CEM18572.1 unnamed protein product [Vitrella brassicaformis CCMP3155]
MLLTIVEWDRELQPSVLSTDWRPSRRRLPSTQTPSPGALPRRNTPAHIRLFKTDTITSLVRLREEDGPWRRREDLWLKGTPQQRRHSAREARGKTSTDTASGRRYSAPERHPAPPALKGGEERGIDDLRQQLEKKDKELCNIANLKEVAGLEALDEYKKNVPRLVFAFGTEKAMNEALIREVHYQQGLMEMMNPHGYDRSTDAHPGPQRLAQPRRQEIAIDPDSLAKSPPSPPDTPAHVRLHKTDTTTSMVRPREEHGSWRRREDHLWLKGTPQQRRHSAPEARVKTSSAMASGRRHYAPENHPAPPPLKGEQKNGIDVEGSFAGAAAIAGEGGEKKEAEETAPAGAEAAGGEGMPLHAVEGEMKPGGHAAAPGATLRQAFRLLLDVHDSLASYLPSVSAELQIYRHQGGDVE